MGENRIEKAKEKNKKRNEKQIFSVLHTVGGFDNNILPVFNNLRYWCTSVWVAVAVITIHGFVVVAFVVCLKNVSTIKYHWLTEYDNSNSKRNNI